ncbi:hypothetical protein Tco_0442497 [Tanacetum coccineum]
MDESVGSSASYVIISDSKAAVAAVPVIVPEVALKAEAAVVASPAAVLDLVLESNMETEPSPFMIISLGWYRVLQISYANTVLLNVVTKSICDSVTGFGRIDDNGNCYGMFIMIRDEKEREDVVEVYLVQFLLPYPLFPFHLSLY